MSNHCRQFSTCGSKPTPEEDAARAPGSGISHAFSKFRSTKCFSYRDALATTIYAGTRKNSSPQSLRTYPQIANIYRSLHNLSSLTRHLLNLTVHPTFPSRAALGRLFPLPRRLPRRIRHSCHAPTQPHCSRAAATPATPAGAPSSRNRQTIADSRLYTLTYP